jgi:hypothetical protein
MPWRIGVGKLGKVRTLQPIDETERPKQLAKTIWNAATELAILVGEREAIRLVLTTLADVQATWGDE